MRNYLRLAEMITYNHALVETYNGQDSLYAALEQVCDEFKNAEFHQKGFACTVVYNILVDKSRGLNLDKYDSFDVDNSINSIYGTEINMEQFSTQDFDYYHCHFDPISLQAEVADDFDDVIATINTKDIIMKCKGLPLAVAIKQHLLNIGKVKPHDIVKLVMDEQQESEDGTMC